MLFTLLPRRCDVTMFSHGKLNHLGGGGGTKNFYTFINMRRKTGRKEASKEFSTGIKSEGNN